MWDVRLLPFYLSSRYSSSKWKINSLVASALFLSEVENQRVLVLTLFLPEVKKQQFSVPTLSIFEVENTYAAR